MLETIGVIAGLSAILIIVIDIYLLLFHGYQATLSWFMYTVGMSHPIIPSMVGLGLGLLLGHFYWPQGGK